MTASGKPVFYTKTNDVQLVEFAESNLNFDDFFCGYNATEP